MEVSRVGEREGNRHIGHSKLAQEGWVRGAEKDRTNNTRVVYEGLCSCSRALSVLTSGRKETLRQKVGAVRWEPEEVWVFSREPD